MATTGTGKKPKRKLKSSSHSYSVDSSSTAEIKKISKKKKVRSVSLTDPTSQPLDLSDVIQQEKCPWTEEEFETTAKSRLRNDPNTNTGQEADTNTSNKGTGVPKLVISPYQTEDDEGIGETPRSSNSSDLYERSGKRKPNSLSVSSIGSTCCPGILEDEEDVEEKLDDSTESSGEEEMKRTDIKQEKNPSANKSIHIASTLQMKQGVDYNSDATPFLELLTEKTLPATSKIFQAPHSSASIGDTCPLTPMEPQEVTSDGSKEYAENPGKLQSHSLDDSENDDLSEANAILREASVAIVRDNFDRVQNEYTKILYRYNTKIKQLKKEHKTLKKQHQTEKEILHQEIEKERAERKKEMAKKCTLASHLEKLQSDTREFQQTKDKVESLKAELREKEEELQKLRTNVLASRDSLSEQIPPVQAGEEQVAQMKESEECLKFLHKLRPDKKKIEDELRRYEYRVQKRPNTT